MNLPSTIFLLTMLVGNFESSIEMRGGLITSKWSVPFQVSIMRMEKIICNGGIISLSHILTAASCVSGFQASAFSVIAGRPDRVDPFLQRRGVETIHLHPNFNTHYDDSSQQTPYLFQSDDIAVLKMLHPLKLTRTALRMVLTPQNYAKVDSHRACMITAWERTNQSSPIGAHLTAALVQSLPIEESLRQGITLGRNQFSVESNIHSIVLSPEDYGTPLLCFGEVTGILIFTNSTPLLPSVFIAVAPYAEFINQITTN